MTEVVEYCGFCGGELYMIDHRTKCCVSCGQTVNVPVFTQTETIKDANEIKWSPMMFTDPNYVVIYVDSKVVEVQGCKGCPFRTRLNRKIVFCMYPHLVDLDDMREFTPLERNNTTAFKKYRPQWCGLTTVGVHIRLEEEDAEEVGGDSDAVAESEER